MRTDRFRWHVSLLALCLFIICATTVESKQSSNSQNHETGESDRVYSVKEVDVKAVIDRQRSESGNPPSSAKCGIGRGLVRLRVILHKSGKVTEVEILEGSGCNSFDKNAVKFVRRLKFTPAKKNGVVVSQFVIYEVTYRSE